MLQCLLNRPHCHAAPLVAVLLAISGTASAGECILDFDAKARIDKYTDVAMGSVITHPWIQACQFSEPTDVALVVGAPNAAYTELPFSNPTYDIASWDGGLGCIIPASGTTPAATATPGTIGGGAFGCDESKAIYWNADTYPRYMSSHPPGQPATWTQPIAITLFGAVSRFDLSSFRVVHGPVDVCVRGANQTAFTKPAGAKNLGKGVHVMSGLYDEYEVRFVNAGGACIDGTFVGKPIGIDDIHIVWN